MGAIADLAAYKAGLAAPHQRIPYLRTVTAVAGNGGLLVSLWSGSTPSTAATCDSTTPGALGQVDAASTQLWLAGISATAAVDGSSSTAINGQLWLLDRLSHQGGLAGNTASTQTTNLPTAALTRSTSGVGVWIALEIYSDVSSTALSVSASYTNQAGTAGRTTPSRAWAGLSVVSSGYDARTMLVLPLQAGDTGARSVESVTLSGAGGLAGNFGVTLFRPLAVVPLSRNSDPVMADAVRGLIGGGIPEIPDGACVTFAVFTPSTISSSASVSGAVSLVEA